jgi:hypothetical protein
MFSKQAVVSSTEHYVVGKLYPIPKDPKQILKLNLSKLHNIHMIRLR